MMIMVMMLVRKGDFLPNSVTSRSSAQLSSARHGGLGGFGTARVYSFTVVHEQTFSLLFLYDSVFLSCFNSSWNKMIFIISIFCLLRFC